MDGKHFRHKLSRPLTSPGGLTAVASVVRRHWTKRNPPQCDPKMGSRPPINEYDLTGDTAVLGTSPTRYTLEFGFRTEKEEGPHFFTLASHGQLISH